MWGSFIWPNAQAPKWDTGMPRMQAVMWLCCLEGTGPGVRAPCPREGVTGVSMGTAPREGRGVSVGTAPREGRGVSVDTAPQDGTAVIVGTAPQEGTAVSVGTTPWEGRGVSMGTAPREGTAVSVGPCGACWEGRESSSPDCWPPWPASLPPCRQHRHACSGGTALFSPRVGCPLSSCTLFLSRGLRENQKALRHRCSWLCSGVLAGMHVEVLPFLCGNEQTLLVNF